MWETQSLTEDQVFKKHLGDPRESLHFEDLLFSYSILLTSKIHHNCIFFTFPLSLESRWVYSSFLMKYALGQEDSNYSIFFDEVLYIGERFK